MCVEKEDVNLAEIMAQIEETIGQHYQVYAEKFKGEKDFWSKLASQEADHAQWIRDLYAETEKGTVSFNEARFDKESVKEFRKHLGDMLAYIRETDMSLKEALEDSLKVEKMLLEKNMVEVFQTDSPELQETINSIVEQTMEHRRSIEDLLKKC